VTKINISTVLKGMYIYAFSERISIWDAGNWEWF
jgi:hypothetical protein